jgi:hypothetical protein
MDELKQCGFLLTSPHSKSAWSEVKEKIEELKKSIEISLNDVRPNSLVFLFSELILFFLHLYKSSTKRRNSFWLS